MTFADALSSPPPTLLGGWVDLTSRITNKRGKEKGQGLDKLTVPSNVMSRSKHLFVCPWLESCWEAGPGLACAGEAPLGGIYQLWIGGRARV